MVKLAGKRSSSYPLTVGSALSYWYRSGIDPAREMIKLTTYLGHSSPSNTDWYIEAVPELLNRLEERQKLEPESENVTRVTPEEADEAPVDDPAGGLQV